MRIAIIGAGMAGLSAARTLIDSFSYQVVLFEKSRGVGGRVATRRAQGTLYDHGAQYFKTTSTETLHIYTDAGKAWHNPLDEMFHHLPQEDLTQIAKGLWTFDHSNQIVPGDEKANAEPRWIYRQGLNQLPKLLAAELPIHFQTFVERLEPVSGGWRVIAREQGDQGVFDRVLVTIPAAQAVELLARSPFEADVKAQLTAEMARAQYRRCISVMLGYWRSVRSYPFYALLNLDRQHAISWLAAEHEKGTQRVPAGQGLWIAQMASDWSLAHYEDATEGIVPQVAEMVSTLLGENLRQPDWHDVQRWQYAQPTALADFGQLNAIHPTLKFAGDWTHGGRVQFAVQAGLDAARLLSVA